MATYITLVRFTEKGITNIKQSPARIEAAKQAFRAAGAELKQWYLALGRNDVVTIAEAPNDETMAKLSLSIGSLGNVRIETLRVFSEDEFRKMIAAMP